MNNWNGSERPEKSNAPHNFDVEQELLDSDLAMRTAMYFGLGVTKEEAFNRVGVPSAQSDSWDELWDDIEKERMWKILSGVSELEGDKYFVRRSLYRLRPPLEPQHWSSGGWKTCEFLLEALQNRSHSLNSIDLYYAYDSYPEAFPDGEPEPPALSSFSQDPLPSQPKLSDGSGMPIDEFIELAKQQTLNEKERLQDIVSGRSAMEVDEYFEGLTLFRLTPDLVTQVWSNRAWENEPGLLHELREGRLPETIDNEDVREKFPEVM